MKFIFIVSIIRQTRLSFCEIVNIYYTNIISLKFWSCTLPTKYLFGINEFIILMPLWSHNILNITSLWNNFNYLNIVICQNTKIQRDFFNLIQKSMIICSPIIDVQTLIITEQINYWHSKLIITELTNY